MMELLFKAVSIPSLLLAFYGLMVIRKDVRARREQPYLRHWIIKIAFTGVVISQFGYLVFPGDNSAWWLTYNVSGLILMIAFVVKYKKRYQDIPIQLADGTELVHIPTDEYGPLAPGIDARVYLGGEPIVAKEGVILDAIKGYDLSLFDVIFIDAAKGSEFPYHFQLTDEIMVSAIGEAEIHPDYPKPKPGSPVTMPAGKDHYFFGVTDFIGAALIKKQRT